MTVTIINGDCLDILPKLPSQSVHCCITSPPYYGLRNYNVDGQIGLEDTPSLWIEKMVQVFREVRRVLRNDGTLWINIGDSYASIGGAGTQGTGGQMAKRSIVRARNKRMERGTGRWGGGNNAAPNFKPKDLMMMPARLALALHEDGWYLRSDIIWAKPNPMPESVMDRPTKSHEHIFLFSKSSTYFYDAVAIQEALTQSSIERLQQPNFDNHKGGKKDYGHDSNRSSRKAVENLAKKVRRPAGWASGSDHTPIGWATEKAQGRKSGNKERKPGSARGCPEGSSSNVCGSVPWEGMTRNKRDVWSVATQPFSEAHFATFPPKLIEPCIMAGTSEKGVCPMCASPMMRIIKSERIRRDQFSKEDPRYRPNKYDGAYENINGKGDAGYAEVETIGWRLKCKCTSAQIRPDAMVLDPFLGAGTTGLVCDRLRRGCIGIELNPEYSEMAKKRIIKDGGMFSVVNIIDGKDL